MSSTQTLMITTQCSAKCSHCYFASAKMPKRFLAVDRIVSLVQDSPSPLTVISGGEPLEHPAIEEILSLMGSQIEKPNSISKTISWRLATGGHIDLSPYFDKWQSWTGFTGVSLGTDILLQPMLVSRWRANWEFLVGNRVPFSITITATDLVITYDVRIILEILSNLKGQPDFVFLRTPSGFCNDEDLEKLIRSHMGSTNIVRDYFLKS